MTVTHKRNFSRSLAALAAVAALPAFAQLGANVETNAIYQTEVIENDAWTRAIVTEVLGPDAAPELKDRMGAFVSAQNLAALGVSAANAHRVAAAWKRGFEQGTNMLAEAMSHAVNTGTLFKLCYPLIPSATRRSVDIFVVSNEYDSVRNRDCLWLYVSRDLPMKPIARVPYVWDGGWATNYVVGTFAPNDVPGAHWTNTVNVARFGQTYERCHRCWFVRPAALKDTPIFTARHGSFGGRNGDGMEWGSIAVQVDGTPAYTGAITNAAAGTVAVFSNGGFIGITQIGE